MTVFSLLLGSQSAIAESVGKTDRLGFEQVEESETFPGTMSGPSVACFEKEVIEDVLIAATYKYSSAMDTLQLYEKECFVVFLDEFDLTTAEEAVMQIENIEIAEGVYYDRPVVYAIPVCDRKVHAVVGFTLDADELHPDTDGRLQNLQYMSGEMQDVCNRVAEETVTASAPSTIEEPNAVMRLIKSLVAPPK